MHERKLDNDLAAIEAQLASFRPPASRLDRDRTMFLAGQAATEMTADGTIAARRNWRWPAAFGAMTTVAAGLLVALIVQRQSSVVPRLAAPARPVREAPRQPTEDQGHRRALEPEPLDRTWTPAAEALTAAALDPAWDRDALSVRHQALYLRLSAQGLLAGVDPLADPARRWPKRIRRQPRSLPYAEQRRALLEEFADPADRRQPIEEEAPSAALPRSEVSTVALKRPMIPTFPSGA